nr:hypothetical protein [Tanacetum cinerariifolium]
MTNPEDITDPTTVMNMALALMAKEFKLNYSTPTNNNQRISSNLRNRQIAQPGMNMGQDRQMQMIGGNGGNQFRQYAGQNAWNLNGYNAVQNVENQANQIGNGNLVAVRAEGNAAGHIGNQISAPVYDSDGLAEVHEYENCYNNEIFNMFTQEEQYTKLLEPILESHQVPQNDNEVISEDSSKNTKFAKQPIAEILSKIGMFRISPDKVSKEAKKVPNTVSASSRTKPITVSQPSVITKKGMNSNLNGLSSTGLDNTKTRRPQPRSNTKNDRVPSTSKSSRSMNKEVKVEEHHRNLLFSKKNKHSSSACNNSKIDSQDVISKVVCAMCKKCLISVNHDECLVNYVNGKKSHGRKHKANVSKNEMQQKNQPEIKKSKNVGSHKSLATPKPRKPRFLLRWSPTGRLFDHNGKLVASSKSESQVDCSNGDNACTSNEMEPKVKWFPNSTYLLGRLSRFIYGASTQVVPST